MRRISRRSFLKAGGGLVLGFHLPAGAQTAVPNPELNAWIMVQPNETVVIRYARAEMGQGSMTAAAQLVAEELECDWRRVRVEYADTNDQLKRARAWGSMASSGSRTIRDSQQVLRSAGAAAREMLVAAAAQAWSVSGTECRAAAGVVMHVPSGRRATYGRLTAAAAKLEPPKAPGLKAPSDWKLAGKPLARLDIPDIVTGRARYGIDTQLPGMVYAAIAQSPVLGGRIASVDDKAVRERRGVLQVLALGDFVAVVADNWWRASQALRALPIVWESGEHDTVSSERIERYLRQGLEADAPARLVRSEGDAPAAIAQAERVFESRYATPFLAHVTLEPPSCTAMVKDGQVDVWASTQDAEATHAAAAAAAGVPSQRVYLHRTHIGGGFGRRLAQDYARQAVIVAKALNGVPVNVIWSREEDVQHDFYRPAGLVQLRTGLDDGGFPVGWECRVAAPTLPGMDALAGLSELPYWIPHQRIDSVERRTPVPVGYWRGGAYGPNVLARECFMDELAHASGRDPLDFRLRLLPAAAKERTILEAACKAARWDSAPAQGVHRGLAVAQAFGTFVAAVAELSVRDRKIDLRRLLVAIDPGHIVNPDNVVAQIQGAAVFALSALFWGEITVKAGRVEQSNFNDQRLLKLSEMPPVEVLLAATGGFWGGVGEPGGIVVAPAVLNALFSATGERVRTLPLKNLGYDLA